MFGGQKFSKSSEILRGGSVDKVNSNGSYNSISNTTVNDSLFQKIIDAENHAKMILKDGQSKYVDGIKQNVIDLVQQWLQTDSGNIFVLYGKMGCGKSFFSARLYDNLSKMEETYYTVAFSSQQIYRDTTSVRNMLLSVAHQLFVGIPGCRKYLTDHLLDSESISNLTEGVFISSFEGISLQKPAVIVIDGLDEYPAEDCVTFLEALGSLRSRINPRVKIFFTSRPESYIMSEIACESDNNCYHIEKNGIQSQADCARFIDVKCSKANVIIDEDLKQQLIEKSECSLKYLDCFFNDIACNSIQVTADFIENLPRGLSQYYRDQLVRYFGDQNLGFYQTKIVPLLELLCVVLRPITLKEAADILGYREADVSKIISRSGTLLWKNGQYIMLYQSESIREFLMDERYCPERYRIDSENGKACVLRRLEEMMDEREDIESNMYLFNCAAEHIMEQERISRHDWMLFVRMIGCYSHKADVVRKISLLLLEKPERDMQVFFQHLLTENSPVNAILQDAFCVRIVASAINEKRIDKLLSVLNSLPPIDTYDFLISYGRARCLRNCNKKGDAMKVLEPYLQFWDSADIRTRYRYTYYIDEACRIYRSEDSIPIEENTRLHVQVIEISEELCRMYRSKDSSVYFVMLRNLSVSYDQLARLSEKLANQSDPKIRSSCAEILKTVLKLQESDPLESGFFLLAAAACYNEELRLSKVCQQCDTFSDSRIYDLHYAFYALGNLYSNKKFPAYNLEKAKAYYDDCLTSIMEIAMNPESHERYIRVPIKIYDKLVEIYAEDGQTDVAKLWLSEGIRMRDRYALYHPGPDSEFDRAYAGEIMAKMILQEQGIDAAESYYLSAVEQYKACCEKYEDEFIQRAPGFIYYKLANEYKKVENAEKQIEYLRLEMAESEKMCRLYPGDAWLWDLGVTQENLARALRFNRYETTLHERISLLESSIGIYTDLEAANPNVTKYIPACAFPFYYIFFDYLLSEDWDKAKEIMERNFALLRRIARSCPEYNTLFDVPVRQFLDLEKRIPQIQGDDKLFDTCKAYLEEIGSLTEEDDFMAVQYNFMVYEAQRIQKSRGIQEAEQSYLNAIQSMKSFLDRCQSDRTAENVWYSVVNAYLDLHAGFRRSCNNGKARYYLQKAVEELDYAIERLTDTVELRKWRCRLYGALADNFKDESDVSLVSTAADLYIQQISQYISLYEETGDKSFLQLRADVYKKVQDFLMIQENVVKFAKKYGSFSKEKIRLYVSIVINVYTNLFDSDKVKEKIEYYKKLLEEID